MTTKPTRKIKKILPQRFLVSHYKILDNRRSGEKDLNKKSKLLNKWEVKTKEEKKINIANVTWKTIRYWLLA